MAEIKIKDSLGLCNESVIECEIPRISVDNQSNEYIIVRTEDVGFVIVPPKTVFSGNAWRHSLINNEVKWDMEYNIDNGKIDGVILKSGDIFKVSDAKAMPINVRLKVKQGKKSAKTGFYSLRDYMVNDLYDKLKKPLVLVGKSDFSGDFYFLNGKTRPGRWLDISESEITLFLENYSCKREDFRLSFKERKKKVYQRFQKIIYPELRKELEQLKIFMNPCSINDCCLYQKDYFRKKLWSAAYEKLEEKDFEYIFLGKKE